MPAHTGCKMASICVRISKVVNGSEQIPAKYNKQSTLGCEVSYDASYMPGPVVFDVSAD